MIRFRPLAGLLLIPLLAGCSRHPATPSSQPSARPERIVSVAPSVTEILFAIGVGPRVVGTDDYSNYPPQAKKLPHVGGITLNYEAIVALHPSLVIGVQDLQGPNLEHMRKLGLNVLAIDTTSYQKTESAIRQVGAAVGEQENAGKVADRMAMAWQDVSAASQGKPRRSVLIVAGAEPSVIVAGKNTFLDGLLAAAGGTNAAPVSGYAPLSREVLATLRPDLVLVGSPKEAAAMRRRFSSGAAPRIGVMPRDILVRPGPRLADGLKWLARTIRGTSA